MKLFFVIIFISFVLGFFLILKFSRKKKLTDSQKKVFLKNLTNIKKLESEKEKIVDLDKLYHHILKSLGYSGTFGEILKSKPKKITDLNKLWELHKLRNKLVHEFGTIDNDFLGKKSKEYEREVRRLIG